MKATVTTLLAALCAVLSQACAAPGGGGDQGQDTGSAWPGRSADWAVESFLRDRGFEGDIHINREIGLIVIDDMGLELAAVEEAMRAQEQDNIEKGYTFLTAGPVQGFWPTWTPETGATFVITQPIASSKRGNIKLQFVEPGGHPWANLPNHEFWKASFREAAAQWSSASIWGASTSIRIAENKTGPTIKVMTSTMNFCGSNPCYAVAGIPTSGNPGGFVLINPNITPTCSGGWVPPGCSGGDCFARMVKVALHELGHTLGLMHPADGAAFDQALGTNTYIPFTNVHTSSTNTYPSVMHTGDTNLCNETGVLSGDDRWSAVLLYPQ